MTGPVKNDSMSRYDDSSALYNVAGNRNAPVKQLADPKDVLQPVQSEGVKMTTKTTGLQLPHESFVAVVQVGKYMFLAIMIPPYLCLYGIPKWFVMNFLPKTYTFITHEIVRIGRFFYDLGSRVQDVMRELMEQFLGDALTSGNHQAKKFVEIVASSFSGVGKKIGEAIQQGLALVALVKNKLSEISLPVVSKLKEALPAFAKAAGQTVLGAGEAIRAFTEPVVTPLIAAVVAPIYYLGEFLKSMKSGTEHVVAVVSERVREVVEKVRESILVPVVHQVQVATQAVIQPVMTWMQTTFKPINETFKSAWGTVVQSIVDTRRSIVEGLERVTRPAFEAVQKAGEKTTEYVKQSAEVVYTMTINLFVQAWNKIPTWERRKGEGRRQSGFKQFAQKVGKKIVEGVAAVAATTMGFFSWLMSLFIEQWMRFSAWVGRVFLAAPKYLLGLTIKVFDRVKIAVRWIALAVRSLGAVIYTLFQVSLEQTRVLSEKMITRLGSKK